MRHPSRNRYHLPAATITLLVLALVGTQSPSGMAAWAAGSSPGGPSLVRIEVDRPLESLGVPIVAHLQDAAGREYALAMIPISEADAAGLSYTVLDPDAAGAVYLLARETRPGLRRQAARSQEVLLDDGRRVVVRAEVGRAEKLAAQGFDLSLLRGQPLVLRAPATMPAPLAIPYDSEVATMVDEVDEGTVFDYVGDLSGENPVPIGGSEYTITTRRTDSGTPIEMATRYVYEQMQALGLAVSYQSWTDVEYSGRNVIAEMPGQTRPGEIVLVTAHLDDMPPGELAPGADDNASGCVAVMIAAEIMRQRHFERTVRFVFFTGEEQGLLGAEAYADAVAGAGENLVAVFNLDMIAWDDVGGPVLRLHTRVTTNPGYAGDLAIADLFVDVVDTYGLDSSLLPIITASGVTASDHSRLWAWGYSAILAIEDGNDFNDYYHTPEDRREHLNMAYFTSFVKAAVGTAAHLGVYSDYDLTRPNQLRATILSPSQVLLRWNDRSDNERFFDLELRSGSGAWESTASVGTNVERAVLTGLTPKATVSFRARARNSSTGSEWSNRQTVNLPAALARPEKLQVTALAATQVRCEWNDMSGNESSFEVQLRSGSEPWEDAASLGANVEQVVFSELTPETTYTFRVRARSKNGLSEWSPKQRITMPAVLVRPNQLAATVLSSTSVQLEWNDRSDNESSFEVQLRSGSGSWEAAASVGADVERVVVSGLTPETTYTFRVRARHGSGFSDWSNRQTLTLPAGG
ncbi:MAG: M20/M25/M40 family metallo-hydrolase [bacterium]|nr:M20/M25/M40 family metallo-hydrolase [bacterium]